MHTLDVTREPRLGLRTWTSPCFWRRRRLCPSWAHVQPPNRTPPGFSPHYPGTPRPCDPICPPLLPAHLLSQMRCGRPPPHRGGAIVTYGERSGFIPSGLPYNSVPHRETAAPREADQHEHGGGGGGGHCCSRGSFVLAFDKIRHQIEAWRRLLPSDGINSHPISSSRVPALGEAAVSATSCDRCLCAFGRIRLNSEAN